MAVPFRKVSKTSGRMRRTHYKLEATSTVKCPNCLLVKSITFPFGFLSVSYFKHPQDLQVPLLNDLLVTSFVFPHSHWHIQTNPPLIFLLLF